ncbi:hypothetical protein DsansV1_C13g0119471 [Dioscorea sansibarensis]
MEHEKVRSLPSLLSDKLPPMYKNRQHIGTIKFAASPSGHWNHHHLRAGPTRSGSFHRCCIPLHTLQLSLEVLTVELGSCPSSI